MNMLHYFPKQSSAYEMMNLFIHSLSSCLFGLCLISRSGRWASVLLWCGCRSVLLDDNPKLKPEQLGLSTAKMNFCSDQLMLRLQLFNYALNIHHYYHDFFKLLNMPVLILKAESDSYLCAEFWQIEYPDGSLHSSTKWQQPS